MKTFGWMKAAGLAVTMATASVATSASAQDITFNGFAQGCFSQLACTPDNSATIGGLTYVTSSFSVRAPFVVGGQAGIGNGVLGDKLGTFSLTTAEFNYSAANQKFTLGVTFQLPQGTTPSQQNFSALLTGNVTSTGSGNVTIDFDNTPIAFAFSNATTSGAFVLRVNDIDLTPGSAFTPLTGRITVTATPGPVAGAGLMALLGMVGAGFAARRRLQNAA